MIRSTHINKELRDLTKIASDDKADEKTISKGILKGITLLIKVARDIRTNQVEIMKKDGVELKKDQRAEDKPDA
jgi:hypothetical protein